MTIPKPAPPTAAFSTPAPDASPSLLAEDEEYGLAPEPVTLVDGPSEGLAPSALAPHKPPLGAPRRARTSNSHPIPVVLAVLLYLVTIVPVIVLAVLGLPALPLFGVWLIGLVVLSVYGSLTSRLSCEVAIDPAGNPILTVEKLVFGRRRIHDVLNLNDFATFVREDHDFQADDLDAEFQVGLARIGCLFWLAGTIVNYLLQQPGRERTRFEVIFISRNPHFTDYKVEFPTASQAAEFTRIVRNVSGMPQKRLDMV